MTAPRAFTQAECRSTAAMIRQVYPHWSRWADMLDAFAARLEDNEDGRAALSMNDPAIVALIDRAAEKLREEGRREVLREVAAIDPAEWSENYNCIHGCYFCHKSWPGQEQFYPQEQMVSASFHKPTCLWLRAQEAAKG